MNLSGHVKSQIALAVGSAVAALTGVAVLAVFFVTSVSPDIEPVRPGVIEADVEPESNWAIGIRAPTGTVVNATRVVVVSATLDGVDTDVQPDGSFTSTSGAWETSSVYAVDTTAGGRLVVEFEDNGTDVVLMPAIRATYMLITVFGTFCSWGLAVVLFLIFIIRLIVRLATAGSRANQPTPQDAVA